MMMPTSQGINSHIFYTPSSLKKICLIYVSRNISKLQFTKLLPLEIIHEILEEASRESHITFAKIPHYFSFVGITEVNLRGIERIGKHVLFFLAKQKTVLKKLNLTGCTSIGNEEVTLIAKSFPQLTHLSLWDCQKVSFAAFQCLEKGCIHLEFLRINLGESRSIFGSFKTNSFKGLKNLKDLEISLNKLTDSMLEKLLNDHQRLQNLFIYALESGNQKTIVSTFERIKKSPINLTILIKNSQFAEIKSENLKWIKGQADLGHLDFSRVVFPSNEADILFEKWHHQGRFLVSFFKELIYKCYPSNMDQCLLYLRRLDSYDFLNWGKYFSFQIPYLQHPLKISFNVAFVKFLIDIAYLKEFNEGLYAFQEGRINSREITMSFQFYQFSEKEMNILKTFLTFLSATDLLIFSRKIIEELFNHLNDEEILEILYSFKMIQLASFIEGLIKNALFISTFGMDILDRIEKKIQGFNDTEKKMMILGLILLIKKKGGLYSKEPWSRER